MLLSAASSATGQAYAMDKGVWQFSGGASLNHASGGGGTSVGVGGALGYFVVPRLVLRATAQFNHASANGSSSTGFGLGPGLAYYFGKPASRVHPFLAMSGLYFHQSRSNSLTWTGSGGLALLMVRNVAATGEAYFTQLRYSVPEVNVNTGLIGQSTETREQFGLRFGLAVFLY